MSQRAFVHAAVTPGEKEQLARLARRRGLTVTNLVQDSLRKLLADDFLSALQGATSDPDHERTVA